MKNIAKDTQDAINGQRQVGATTHLIEAVRKDKDAVLVCGYLQQAYQISQKYKIPTISINNIAQMAGRKAKLVFDNSAILCLIAGFLADKEAEHIEQEGQLCEEQCVDATQGNITINIYCNK